MPGCAYLALHLDPIEYFHVFIRFVLPNPDPLSTSPRVVDHCLLQNEPIQYTAIRRLSVTVNETRPTCLSGISSSPRNVLLQ